MVEKDDASYESSTGAANQDNARTRVSAWLSGILDEVRSRGSSQLKQWPGNTPKQQTSFTSSTDISEKGEQSDKETLSNDKSSNPTFLSGLTSLGRSKLNNFYDNVILNKPRYDLIKYKNMDGKPQLKPNSTSKITENDQCENPAGRNIKLGSLPKQMSIDLSIDNDEFNTFSQKVILGEIVRSYPNKYEDDSKSRISASSTPKNINLGNIGRSFSEQNDDDDDDDDVICLNERSRSCSHTINNGRCRRNLNFNNSVSTSLPSFLENKTISANPLKVKRQLSRDASLSENISRNPLIRDSSVQSDSSHCSSVESLLEARKPDPEAILINLGFGPVESEDILSRIPKRFLKPSQVKGIDTEAFLRRQQLASHLHDHSVLGYRGLVGNPDIPPSMIVAKIMERFEINERNRCIMDINLNRPQSAPPTPGPRT